MSKKKIADSRDKILAIIVLTVMLAMGCIKAISLLENLLGSNTSNSDSDKSLWEKAYNNVESKKMGIQFDKPLNTNAEYKILKAKCDEFLAESGNEDLTKVNVDTLVYEETFVDNYKYNRNELGSAVSDLYETGPLYLDNMVIIRYINKEGNLKTIISIFDGDSRTQTKLVKRSDLHLYQKPYTENSESNQAETESYYILKMSKLLNLMFSSVSKQDDTELTKLLGKYFTDDGMRSLYEETSQLKLEANVECSVVFIQACKSDLDLMNKDRVYAQILVDKAGESLSVNLILKMNRLGRVFDVDIL